MDVLQFRLGLHGRGGGLRRDGTHATPEQARAIARKMIASYKDWGDGDYDALVWLWNKESGWQWNATNPSSGAYGIPQALPASKLASAGDDWKDNAATQIKWGLNYIAGRYGSPQRRQDVLARPQLVLRSGTRKGTEHQISAESSAP